MNLSTEIEVMSSTRRIRINSGWDQRVGAANVIWNKRSHSQLLVMEGEAPKLWDEVREPFSRIEAEGRSNNLLSNH